jgi:DNA-binding response OmpR family regulator
VPVVVLTAKDLTDEDRQRLNGGAARIVPKGEHTTDDLLAHVRGVLDTRQASPNPRPGPAPPP